MSNKYSLVPYSIIKKAIEGDENSISIIVKHYQYFIIKNSMRLMTDNQGYSHMIIDDTLKGRIEGRLLSKILLFRL